MEKYCKNCGAKISPDNDFCQDCGSKIEHEKITCKNCGAELKKDMKFCTECGNPTYATTGSHPESGTTAKDAKSENFISKNKNMLIVVLLVAAVLIVVSALALTGTAPEAEPQNVEVGSTNFIIPGDYQIDPSSIDVDYKYASAIFAKGWVNDNGDTIYIGTMTVPYNVDAQSVISAEGGSHKSMMGYDGYYSEDEGLYNFAFETGGYICVVTVSNPDTFDEITCLG